MEDYYEYLDSNGVTTLYKLIKDDTVALIDSYSVTINGITTTLDTHVNNTDIHTPISDIESMVDTKISGLVNSAPETLDTLKELSDALGNDPNFATTVANQIGNKANKDSVYTKEETDTLLESKANSVHSHVVNDITDFPTIPTKTSELSNDSNFVTSTELHDYATKNDLNSKQDALSEEQLSNIDSIPDKANKSDLSTVATSGSYKDLLDKPVIPEGSDLSDYYNKGETDNLLNSKANTSDLAVVAKSGNYNDLNNTPAIPTKLSQLENDMGFGSGSGGVITSISWTNITDKPNFATVATSGSYNDLSNKPTIPKVYNKTLTIQKNGTNVATFTSNSNTDVTANITVPTKTSDLTNDSGFITGISWDKVTNKPTLAKVATSGSYTDLSNTPTIPTKVSQLENDTGFINALTDVVDTKSNQTINGTKTFTASPFVSGGGATTGIYLKNTAIARNEVPSTTYYSVLRTLDKNNEILGDYVVMKTDKGATNAQINIRSEDSNGNQLINAVNFSMANDNSSVSFAPSISNKVSLGTSTYKWAKVHSDDVVHTSGNETIAGNKTFSNQIYLGAGGTSYGQISAKDNNSILRLFGGTSPSTGANLDLYGENLSDGGFSLRARTSDKIVGLDGKTDGTLKWNGKNVAIDENLVHKSGNETIKGTKTFTDTIYKKNSALDLQVNPSSNQYNRFLFTDKNNVVMGYLEHVQTTTGINALGFVARDKNNVSHGFQVTSEDNVIPFGNGVVNLGLSGAKWKNVYATKINCDNIVRTDENSYIYMTAGPAWNSGASIFLNGKNGDGLGTGKGTFLLFARDGTNERRLLGYPTGILSWNGCIESHEVRSITANAFLAQNSSYTFLIRNDGSNTYFLMSDKDGVPGTWSTARPLTINNSTGVCNINGNANSATYSTTPATTDNSTKIATTAWVRNYVDSVAGSGAVGASISAYYSNATTLTAEGNPSSSGGSYPSDYSDYINISPKVGTIYTGSQLFSTVNASASGSKYSYGTSSGLIYQTTAKATANFSGAFSSSAKYLCTTANAVRFRAYVSHGTPSNIGTASVVDNSSTKSIFIRVQ